MLKLKKKYHKSDYLIPNKKYYRSWNWL